VPAVDDRRGDVGLGNDGPRGRSRRTGRVTDPPTSLGLRTSLVEGGALTWFWQLAQRGVSCAPPTGRPPESANPPFGAGLLGPVLRDACGPTALSGSTGRCDLTGVPHPVGVLPDLTERAKRASRSGAPP
jgi:hypothetical protein